jgi:hypothetical protein
MFTTLPVFCFKYFIQPTKAGEMSSHTYFEPSEMAKVCIQTNSSLEPFALGHKFDLHAYITLPIQRIFSSTYIRGSSMLSPTYALTYMHILPYQFKGLSQALTLELPPCSLPHTPKQQSASPR